MSVKNVPTRTDLTHYDFSMVLDGVTFVLEFRWNLREDAWYFDVRLDDGTNVANGVKVVVDWPLLRGLRSANRPLGEFVAFDTSGERRDAAIDDLGSRVKLYYFDAESLADIAAGL
jgi:hypothetical protein